MKNITLKLKDGSTVEGVVFDSEDYKKLKDIFKRCLDISKELNQLGGRKLNIPDVVSEGIYCYVFNASRTNGDAYSYDAVSLDTHEGIQIKSCSIDCDCTSFGPTSTWDKLIFADFAPNGEIDGNIDFYEIDSNDVYNLELNKSKHETFRMQQDQGRRPRFSIKNKIIKEKKLTPFKRINILE